MNRRQRRAEKVGVSAPNPVPKVGLDDIETEEQAFEFMQKFIGEWLLLEQLQETPPLVASSKLIEALVLVLRDAMGTGAVRLAMLMVLEKTYEHGMNFSDRQAALEQLTQVAQARRQVEGKGGLIIPTSNAAD